MNLDPKMKEFIKNNIDLIEKEDWAKLMKLIDDKSLQMSDLFNIFIKADIQNPIIDEFYKGLDIFNCLDQIQFSLSMKPLVSTEYMHRQYPRTESIKDISRICLKLGLDVYEIPDFLEPMFNTIPDNYLVKYPDVPLTECMIYYGINLDLEKGFVKIN